MSVDPGAFAALRVVVLGDAMLDRYARGIARRLAAEAPAPVISHALWEDRAGGAANAAANAAALGARVALVSLAGDDAAGEALAEAVRAAGVEPCLVRPLGRCTLVKTRLMAGGQLVARLDEGCAGAPDAAAEAALAERLGALLDGADAVIVSDYAYGTVGGAALAALGGWRASGRGPLVADARDLARLAALRPCAVAPNHAEAMALLERAPPPASGTARLAQLCDAAPALLACTGAEAVVATLDGDGALVLREGRPPLHLPAARRLDGAGVTGAGDTFTATLALALATGADTGPAARLACLAAGVAAAKPGTAVCTAAEIASTLAPAPSGPEVLGSPHRSAFAKALDAPPADGAPFADGAVRPVSDAAAAEAAPGSAPAHAPLRPEPASPPEAPGAVGGHVGPSVAEVRTGISSVPGAAGGPGAPPVEVASRDAPSARGIRARSRAGRRADAGPAAGGASGGVPAPSPAAASLAGAPRPAGAAAPVRAAAPAILPSAAALAALGERLRAAGRRVVLTSGCFDILHDGHLACLEEARGAGDALVVGVNSDRSVRRLKGPSRPVNPCAARMRMLAALSFVDHVVAFDEDTPEALIRALRPRLFAKGGDYDRSTLPEAALVEALGGEVRILCYRPGRSTSAIIARVRAAAATEGPSRAEPRTAARPAE